MNIFGFLTNKSQNNDKYIRKVQKNLEKRNISLGQFDKWLDMQVSGQYTSSNVNVNQTTALTYSAWYNGVLQLSQTVASMPFVLYRREGQGKRRLLEDPLFNVLAHWASPIMMAYQWREATMMNLINWGNSYSYIERDRGNRIIGLRLLDPSKMQIIVDYNTKAYRFRRGNGEDIIFMQDEILHTMGLTENGIEGISVLEKAARDIGVGIAEEEFKSKFFGNGTNLGGILKHPNKLSKEAKESLKNQMAKNYSGLSNAHKIMVLEEGMTFDKMGMPLKDAQFLEGQNFSIQNIARFLNIPPHKLKEQSRSTFNNIQSEQTSWWQDSVRPWVIRIEQSVNNQLINPKKIQIDFAEFMFESILRADIETRYKAYTDALNNGWMNRNEVRARENLNPIIGDGGDTYTVQMNLTDINFLNEQNDSNNMQSDDTGEFERQAKRSITYNDLNEKEKRSLKTRRSITNKYKKRFTKAFQEIWKLEKKQIEKLNTSELRNEVTFLDKLNTYYQENRAKFETILKTVLIPYSQDLSEEVKREINTDQDINIQDSVDYFAFNSVFAYTKEGQKRLSSIVNEDPENANENVSKQLEEWEKSRVDKHTRKNTIAAENAIAKIIFFTSGYSVRWVTVGANCPYCDSMDGKTISRGGAYFQKGELLEPTGASGALPINSNITHPPLHHGCDCTIVAV